MPVIAMSTLVGVLALPLCKDGDTLPLERLRLYETGVGYFQRTGEVSGGTQAALPLPAGHLDDALKTLVVLDGQGGKVRLHGVAFESSVSQGMARALAGLPVEGDGALEYRDLLATLKGAEVVLTAAGGRVSGRLVDVLGPFDVVEGGSGNGDGSEEGQKPKLTLEPQYTLLVVGKDGAVRRVSTRELRSIRPVDPASAARIDVALDALSDRSAQASHPMRVHVEGSGSVTLGYIAETPVWRSTYRVVLDPSGKGAQLQGWALLHNDTDEDWRGIQVELVSGRPTSFLFPLAAPRYEWRELVEPERELATVPQLLRDTVDALWGDNVGEAYGVGGLGLVGTGRGGGGRGSGSGAGFGARGRISASAGSSELDVGDLAEFTQAEARESGALFRYVLPAPLDLSARHSALVPVVQHNIDARSVTWFDAVTETAQSGVRLLNDTGQTLPSGTIAFFGDGGFIGESGLDRLKPGERRFIVHGVELDVELDRSKRHVRTEPRQLRFRDGTLEVHSIRHRETNIELHNRSQRRQTVYVALDVIRNATVEGAPALDYDTESGLPLAVFDVPGGAHVSKVLTIREGIVHGHDIEEVDGELLRTLAAKPRLPARTRKIVAATEVAWRELRTTKRQADAAKREVTAAKGDLARLRADLEALGSAGLRGRVARRLTRRILEKEDRLAEMREESRRLATRAHAQQAGITSRLEQLGS